MLHNAYFKKKKYIYIYMYIYIKCVLVYWKGSANYPKL